MADSRLGQQLLFDAREAQYKSALEQGLIKENDENGENGENKDIDENADGESQHSDIIKPPPNGVYHMENETKEKSKKR